MTYRSKSSGLDMGGALLESLIVDGEDTVPLLSSWPLRRGVSG